jgi:hypothetical protein
MPVILKENTFKTIINSEHFKHLKITNIGRYLMNYNYILMLIFSRTSFVQVDKLVNAVTYDSNLTTQPNPK